MNKNANALLVILQDYAPTGSAQQTCTDMYLKMQLDGVRGDELVKAMANTLADGFNYGNWPWVVYKND